MKGSERKLWYNKDKICQWWTPRFHFKVKEKKYSLKKYIKTNNEEDSSYPKNQE